MLSSLKRACGQSNEVGQSLFPYFEVLVQFHTSPATERLPCRRSLNDPLGYSRRMGRRRVNVRWFDASVGVGSRQMGR